MDKPIFLCSKFKGVLCDLFNRFKGGLVHCHFKRGDFALRAKCRFKGGLKTMDETMGRQDQHVQRSAYLGAFLAAVCTNIAA